MLKKVLVVSISLAVLFSANAKAEEKTSKSAKQPKIVETRINEADMDKLAGVLDKSIKAAVLAKQGPSGFEYLAKRMKPPKTEKWIEKWNELGSEGWEYVDHFENMYIFKRIASGAVKKTASKVDSKDEEKTALKAAEEEEKAAKKAAKEEEKAKEKAEKEAKKEAKKLEKEKKKAAKE